MKFFKPEDFIEAAISLEFRENLADIVNAKLEREGRVVYGYDDEHTWSTVPSKINNYFKSTALLLNIEPIEQCTHPKEKVTTLQHMDENGLYFNRCECGVKVVPESFKVCE